MDMNYLDSIFGYGSLVDVDGLTSYLGRSLTANRDYVYCKLKNFVRRWNVSMDNRINTSNYKYYIDKRDGSRPQVYVTFLNIAPKSGVSITGVIFLVTKDELSRLDQRERNYKRIEVSNQVSASLTNRTWAYVGLPEAEERFRIGFESGSAVISQGYYDLVYNSFRKLGENEAREYIQTTEIPKIPMLDLIQIKQ